MGHGLVALVNPCERYPATNSSIHREPGDVATFMNLQSELFQSLIPLKPNRSPELAAYLTKAHISLKSARFSLKSARSPQKVPLATRWASATTR